MNNENLNGSPSVVNPVSQRDRASINECAEEVNFRAGQFLRALNSPASDAGAIRERAVVLRDHLTDWLELLVTLTHDIV